MPESIRTPSSSDSVGQVQLDMGINYQGFSRQLNGIAGTSRNMILGVFKPLGVAIASAFAVRGLVGFGRAARAEYNALVSHEMKLATIMQRRMGATKDMVTSIKRLADEQERLGVVSGEATMSGAQELATYLRKATSLEKLIPTMNDLVAQQLGLGASAEQVRNIATMLGKVMDGQTGALSRYGFTFTEAQEKILKFGKEEERAALLAEIVADSLGDMNKALGETPEAKLQQATAMLGQARREIGQGIMIAVNGLIPQIKVLAQWALNAARAFSALSAAVFGLGKKQDQAANASDSMALAQGGVAAAIDDVNESLKGSLSGFDQLNVLSQDAAESADEISDGFDIGTSALGFEFDVDTTMMERFESILNRIKGTVEGARKVLSDAFGEPLRRAIAAVAPELDAWRDSLSTAFGRIMSLGEPLKSWFTDHLVPYWRRGIDAGGVLLSGLLESTRMVFSGIFDAAFPVLQWYATDGLSLLTDFYDGALTILMSIWGGVKEIFDTLWSCAVQPGLNLVSRVIMDTLDMIRDRWYQFSDGIIGKLVSVIEGMRQIWSAFWISFLQPVVEAVLKTLSWLWEKHLKQLVDQLMIFVGKLIDGALSIYNEFILPVARWLIERFGPAFANAFQFVIEVAGSLIAFVADMAKSILKALGGIIDFIAGVFTGDWKRAWQGVKDIFGGIWDGMVSMIKGAVNLIIDAVNWMIRGINKIKIDMPSWAEKMFGVGSIGFNIPTIPKLAQGGLITGPTLAMVGDNKNANIDPEVVTPLSKLQEMLGQSNQAVVEVLLAILEALESLDLNIELDGERLNRILRAYDRRESSRLGKAQVRIGGVPV